MSWLEIPCDDESQQRAAIERTRVTAAANSPALSLYHDLEWLLEAEDDPVLLYERTDSSGALRWPLLVQRRPLKFKLGEVTLAALPLTRLTSISGPYVVQGGEPAAASIKDFLIAIQDRLRWPSVLNIEGVKVGEALYRVLVEDAEVARRYLVLETGPRYEHLYIQMPGDYAAFLAQLGTRSRKSLQYSQRKLAKHFNNEVVVRCASAVEDVADYVRDAIAVSKQTYQWHLLGLGLRDERALTKRLEFAARKGWLRSYVLYCAGAPVAFMLGYLYRGTYYYIDVGYATTWKDWSVGSVLQLYVMEDLLNLAQPPAVFDFSTGYGPHKARFGNRSEQQVDLIVARRTWPAMLALGAYRALNTLSARLVQTIERMGLKSRIKQLIRRSSVRATAESQDRVAPGE